MYIYIFLRLKTIRIYKPTKIEANYLFYTISLFHHYILCTHTLSLLSLFQ